MTDRFMIAAGHNNPFDLAYLHELNPPLFADFLMGVEVEWHEAEGEDYSGDNVLVLIGRPFVVALFGALYTAEHAYLKATFATSGARTGPVTVMVHNRDTDTWPVYNAMLELPDVSSLRWLLGGWEDYPLRLYDMDLLYEQADAPTFLTLTDGDYLTLTDGSYVTED